MDWSEYRVEPDAGLFEKIEKRVHMRRAWRWSALTAAAVAVVGAGLWLTLNHAQAPATQRSGEPVATSPVQTITTGITPLPQTHNTTTQPTKATSTPNAKHTMTADNPTAPSQPNTTATAVPHTQAATAEWTSPAVDEQPRLTADVVTPNTPHIDDLILPATQTEESNSTAEKQQETAPKSSSATHYENVFTAPNIIIPSSDEEAVRKFRLYSSSTVDNFKLAIYNRSGRQVFITSDITQTWDGTFNGSLVTQGHFPRHRRQPQTRTRHRDGGSLRGNGQKHIEKPAPQRAVQAFRMLAHQRQHAVLQRD